MKKEQGDYQRIQRQFGPIYDENSRILILGSFPSVKSREANFYYGHPQNRFWPLLAKVLECPAPQTKEEKTLLVLQNHIALWDTIESCEIIGSDDSSIRSVEPVDILQVLRAAEIQAVFTNGGTSYRLYGKYLEPISKIPAVKLPSTSPANAAWNLERLFGEWKQIRNFL